VRALVFGGARYLGAHVVSVLKQHGDEASVIDFPDPLAPDEDPEFEQQVAGQIVPATAHGAASVPLEFDPAEFDVVVFAGVDGYSSGATPPVTDEELAAEFAVLGRLLEAAPRALVLCSSTVVYAASAGGRPLDESTPAAAPGRIAEHLRALEAAAREAADARGFGLAVLRLSVVGGLKAGVVCYGRASKMGYLVPGLRVTGTHYPDVDVTIDANSTGHADRNVGDFLNAADAAAAVAAAASHVSRHPEARELLNVGSAQTLSERQSLATALGNDKLRLDRTAPPPGTTALPAVSCAAIERTLGWKPILPPGLIPMQEAAYFCNRELARTNIGPTARVSNEVLGDFITSTHLVIYGLLFVLDRAGGFSNDNITFEVNQKRYRPDIASERGYPVPFQRVRVSPYRLRIPLEDVRELPIQNPIRIVYVTPDGRWFRRRMRYSLLRSKPRHQHRPLHHVRESDSTLYLRQAGANFLYLTLRARILSDRLSMSPKIPLARLASMVRRRPVILLYEKEASRYEESGSVLFEAMVDRGHTDVRFILDETRIAEVPEKYRRYVVRRFSFEHLYCFFCCRTFIGTEAVAHAAELRTAHRSFLKKLFSNDYRYVFLQHGVMYMVALSSSQRAPFRAGGSILPPGTKIVVSSETEGRHFVELGGFKREDLYVSGLPKFDRAVRDEGADRILIMPTWRPWEHNTIRANPAQAPYYKMVVELFEAVPDHLKHVTSILPHPLLTEVLAGTELRPYLWSEGSYDDALRRCALMITDYSSIVYDAFYRGANAIFWWKEKEYCMQQYGGHLMLEEDTAFGPVCTDAEELRRLVSAAYLAPQDSEYVKRYRDIVTFHDGKNTERLLALIEADGLLRPRS